MNVFARKAITQARTSEFTTVKAAQPPPISFLKVEMVATQGKYRRTNSMNAQLVAGVNICSSLRTVARFLSSY